MLTASWLITFVIIIGIGFYAGKAIQSSAQWSGGDKQLSSWGVGAVLAAWQIGGMSIIGAAQNGYTIGIAGAWYSISGALYFIVVALLADVLRKNMPGDSVPTYLANRFSPKSSKLYSYIWVCMAFMYIPIQLLTISTIIKLVLPGMPSATAMVIGLSIAALYTGFAGMKGASAIGKIVCIGIYVLLVGFVMYMLPKLGGISGIKAAVPPQFSSMGNMPAQKYIGWAIGGLLSSAVMQSVLQPVMAAKDAKSARNGCIIGYIFSAPICIVTATIGLIGKAKGMSLGNGAGAFAAVINANCSPTVTGIIFAVATIIIAATMATMMMATGTILTNIYKTQINPDAEDKKLLAISKYGTIIFSFLTLIPAFLLPTASITTMFLTLIYVATAPVSFSIFAGFFWKKANAAASFWSMLVGVIVGVLWVAFGMVSKLESVYPIIISSYSVGILVTLLTTKKEEALKS